MLWYHESEKPPGQERENVSTQTGAEGGGLLSYTHCCGDHFRTNPEIMTGTNDGAQKMCAPLLDV